MKFLLIFHITALLPLTAWAQQEAVFDLNVNVDLVELHVSVLDAADRPVGGLKEEHFRVLEDQVEQRIAVFAQEDIPLSLGLVIDNSRSIEPRKERLDAAAIAFLQQSNPEDETFVVHFDDSARITRDFTSKIRELERTLASVSPYGQTAIFDAVIEAADHMQHARYQKKAMLLITDGIDNASTHTLQEAIARLRRSRIAVFAVGLLSASGALQAEQFLTQIAEATGGRAYFPVDVAEASTTIRRVARDLREQYTIGYFPSNPSRDGSWRSVRVEISLPADVRIKYGTNYRRGYYAPER